MRGHPKQVFEQNAINQANFQKMLNLFADKMTPISETPPITQLQPIHETPKDIPQDVQMLDSSSSSDDAVTNNPTTVSKDMSLTDQTS